MSKITKTTYYLPRDEVWQDYEEGYFNVDTCVVFCITEQDVKDIAYENRHIYEEEDRDIWDEFREASIRDIAQYGVYDGKNVIYGTAALKYVYGDSLELDGVSVLKYAEVSYLVISTYFPHFPNLDKSTSETIDEIKGIIGDPEPSAKEYIITHGPFELKNGADIRIEICDCDNHCIDECWVSDTLSV